jgi:hypothetical protein
MRGSRSERQVGSIDGFQFYVADNFMQGPEILLKGVTTYTAKATNTAHGTIRSVEHAIQHFEDLVANLEQTIADMRVEQHQFHVPFVQSLHLLGAAEADHVLLKTAPGSNHL